MEDVPAFKHETCPGMVDEGISALDSAPLGTRQGCDPGLGGADWGVIEQSSLPVCGDPGQGIFQGQGLGLGVCEIFRCQDLRLEILREKYP